MSSLEVLRPSQRSQWTHALHNSCQYDFYHLPAYHALAEARGEGLAHLFVYAEGPYCVALPLLLRAIDTEPALKVLGRGWMDATSVYGYAGPIQSHARMPHTVIYNFGCALRDALRERCVVTAFSRLHPLMHQSQVLTGLGECKLIGQTVSIDLTLSASDRWNQYRENHKRDINRATQLGVVCLYDHTQMYFDHFIDMYHETMDRVHASSVYYFDHAYFNDLVSGARKRVHLFVALLDDKAIGGGLFTSCEGLLQYQLGATASEFMKVSPLKLILHTAQSWGRERGMSVLHLGGGVGARQDSLFRFKAGFSDRRHDFLTRRWILFPERYAQLQNEVSRWNAGNSVQEDSLSYFPEYRQPEWGVPGRLTE
jgi:CelD/BcsL family acetyltransferase involved in cellulose biosynthesis